jgi:hypothetical protein
MALVAVSAELAALGPYFAVEFHTAEGDPAWRPMRELIESPDVLANRVAGVRSYLASGTGQEASAVELRVAASVVHLGLVARVLSPLLALAVLHQRSGPVQAADLHWQPTLGSMFPLSVHAKALDPDEKFALGGIVSELDTAIARFGVNEHILRGNTASALAGAGKMLTAARPDLRGDIRALINQLLNGPHLAGSGTYEPAGTFRRRSCCLIYRAAPDPGTALCGDCALAPAHGQMDT